jgi:hypothetical protein
VPITQHYSAFLTLGIPNAPNHWQNAAFEKALIFQKKDGRGAGRVLDRIMKIAATCCAFP